MEIKEMSIEEIESRCLEIEKMLEDDTADYDALSEEVHTLEERKAFLLAEVEERKKIVAEVLDNKTPVIEEIEKEEVRKKMEINELRNTPEYINAYAEYIKGNEKEMRALLSENATNGTVAVPEIVYDMVRTAWEKEGIMSRVRKAYLKGNLKVGFEISGSDAVIHTEGGDAIDPENLVLGIVELVPQSIKKIVEISDEAYDLTGSNFLQYIYDELAYKIAKKCADTLIAKIMACGTVSTTTCPSVPVVSKNIAQDTIATALGNLTDEADTPVIMMNKLTYSAFKSAQYSGNYATDIFEGLPVVFNNTIKAYSVATTGETYAIVGDLDKGALANFPNGEEIEFKFDNLAQKKKDLIEVLGRRFVALGVVAPNHFVKLAKN